jgi:acyl-CoA synthetase (AMP-forming)/AMP-acid ligase II
MSVGALNQDAPFQARFGPRGGAPARGRQVRQVRLGPLTLPNRYFLAPLAGVSDWPFRLLCREMGAAIAHTEMISSHGLVHGGDQTLAYLERPPDERPFAIQVFGHEPDILAEGARIAVVVGNTWRGVAISFACWRAGIGLLPLDPATPAEAVAAHVRDAGCAAAFVAEERLAEVAAALGKAPGRPPLVAVGGGLLGRSGADPAVALDFGTVVLSMGDVFDAVGDPAGEALAGVRGGGATQVDLLLTAGSVAAWLRLHDGDRLLSGLLAHQPAGVAAGLVAPFAAGGGVVLSRGFDPGAFWKRVADERVTVALLQREQAEAVLGAEADPGGLDLGRLRTVACAPEPAPEALAAAWAGRFGLPLSPTPETVWEARL